MNGGLAGKRCLHRDSQRTFGGQRPAPRLVGLSNSGGSAARTSREDGL